mmetsp:Transcript_30420/g.48751  ORF Transcript_30420/g.48751 Transcript_30420/m.48751 type:complete len:215 (-) Transcript_30420:2055-2699(-)
MANNVQLHVWHGPLGADCPENVSELVRGGVSPCPDDSLSRRRVQLFKRRGAEDGLQEAGIHSPAKPNEHLVAIFQQVDTVLRHGLAGQVEHVRQGDSAELVRCCTQVWCIVQRHHSGIIICRRLRYRERLQPVPNVGPHVGGDVICRSEGPRLEHAHDVERQELERLILRDDVAGGDNLLTHRGQPVAALRQVGLHRLIEANVRHDGTSGLYIY